MMPTKDIVMVTGDQDTQGLQYLMDYYEQFSNSYRRLSKHLYVCKQGEWRLFFPKEDHPLFRQLTFTNLKAEQEEYDELRDAIIKELRKEKTLMPRVARYVFSEENHQSAAVLNKCTLTLMPIVQNIILDVFAQNVEDKVFSTCVVPFETFVSVCGERLSPCPYSQEYFFVEGFPSKEELRQMGVDVKHPLFQE